MAHIPLDPAHSIWERFFLASPLVLVATREPDGSFDLAPKHMAMPLGWEDFFGFVCTPAHATYRNAQREGCFTVSFPRADQIVLTSLAAAPRCADAHKHGLDVLPTVPATRVDGVLLESATAHLECELDRIVDGFGGNSLVAGRVVAAQVDERALREPDVDDNELLARSPVLAFLYPGRYAAVANSRSFPFHVGFRR